MQHAIIDRFAALGYTLRRVADGYSPPAVHRHHRQQRGLSGARRSAGQMELWERAA